MNKKIKVIELASRVYQRKDIPKKVKYNSTEYKYSEEFCDYENQLGNYLFSIITLRAYWMNEEVEILEDEDEEEIDIEDIKNEYNEHAKNIINDLIKDGYELEGIKESIEAMINYIESIKEKIAIKKQKKLKKRKIYQKFFKKVQKFKK